MTSRERPVVLREIPGVDASKYRAGSDGHIYCYSTARVNARKPRPFRVQESIGSNGYPFIALIQDGRRRSVSVHVLICLAFRGSKPTLRHEVRHLDGDARNCAETNLAWGTPAENEADKKRHGTAAVGSRHGAAKLTDEAVRTLRIAIPRGLWNPIDAAKVFGVDPSTIRRVAAGEDWKHIKVDE